MKNESDMKREAVCPLCGMSYRGRPALSREDNETPVCPDCGTRQALAAMGVGADEQEEIVRIIHAHMIRSGKRMTNLPLPCPFCGGTNLKVHTAFGVQGNLICASCQAEGPLAFAEFTNDVLHDLVVEAWNRRAVKHGHILINDDGDFTCSVCGERYVCKGNYCSNCAARLDGRDSYVAGTYLDWDNGKYVPTFGEDN